MSLCTEIGKRVRTTERTTSDFEMKLRNSLDSSLGVIQAFLKSYVLK